MGGGTFILLKAGRRWPESAKQTEICLAILLKMLTDRPFWDGSPRQRAKKRTPDGCIYCYFRGIWLIHQELFPLLPSSQFSPGNWRSIVQASVAKKIMEVYVFDSIV